MKKGEKGKIDHVSAENELIRFSSRHVDRFRKEVCQADIGFLIKNAVCSKLSQINKLFYF